MKIYGQLEYVQFEKIASGSPTPAVPGRFYLDTTTPSDHKPKIYLNGSWETFAMESATSDVQVITTAAQTQVIDWSVSKTWIVRLASNVVFTFTNPAENELHTLIIQQADIFGPAPYAYCINMHQNVFDGAMVSPRNILPANGIRIYEWMYKTNALTSGTALNRRSVTASGFTAFGAGGGTTPACIDVYPFTSREGVSQVVRAGGNTASVGTENFFCSTSNDRMALYGKTNFQFIVSNITATRFSPDGVMMAQAAASSPFLAAAITYSQKWGGFSSFSVLTAPAALAGAAQAVDWHPNGNFVAAAHTTAPSMSILPITPGAWGLKIADPATLPAGNGLGVAFAPTGDYVAVTSASSPFLQVYPFSDLAGAGLIGLKASDPSVLPTVGPAGPRVVSWHPTTTWIAMALTASPYIYLVPFDRTTGTFGAPVTPTGTLPAGAGRCVSFSPDGKWLAVGYTSSMYVYPFDASNGSIGTPLTYQAGETPAQIILDIAWSSDSKWLAATDGVAANFPYVFRMPRQNASYTLVRQQ